VAASKRLLWFKRWVSKKQPLKDLARQAGRSVKTLQRWFAKFFNNPPKPKPLPNPACIALIDGSYFKRISCSVLYYDHKKKNILWWRWSSGEHTEEIIADLEALKARGVILKAAVTDGRKALILALKTVYPDIVLQRCLVHLERRTLAWLTQNPKYQAGRELRALCLVLNVIDSKRKRNLWLELFAGWQAKYEEFLKERTKSFDGRSWRYTHRNLRRVRRHLLNALPCMFTYLDHRDIPKDTNQLEGGKFSGLKETVFNHRGVPKTKRPSFLSWYYYFKQNP
jgi:hypothetical protein